MQDLGKAVVEILAVLALFVVMPGLLGLAMTVWVLAWLG